MKREYLIAIEGTQYGPYPEDQVVEMVSTGQIQRIDYCWTEGMQEWLPVQNVISLPIQSAPKILPSIPNVAATQGKDPWFLYIPVGRFVFLSIATFGLFERYWIYKNYRYLKERDNLKVTPFLRGVFGVFFVHGILKRIHQDEELSSSEKARFSPGALAAGWIVLILIGNILGNADEPTINLVGLAVSIPSFLFLLPAQNYINRSNENRTPKPFHSPWSKGQIIVLILGFIIMGLVMVGFFAPE